MDKKSAENWLAWPIFDEFSRMPISWKRFGVTKSPFGILFSIVLSCCDSIFRLGTLWLARNKGFCECPERFGTPGNLHDARMHYDGLNDVLKRRFSSSALEGRGLARPRAQVWGGQTNGIYELSARFPGDCKRPVKNIEMTFYHFRSNILRSNRTIFFTFNFDDHVLHNEGAKYPILNFPP